MSALSSGGSTKDPKSFNGHPICQLCGSQHYDEEPLVKHLQQVCKVNFVSQQDHFSCYLCSGPDAPYTFYRGFVELVSI